MIWSSHLDQNDDYKLKMEDFLIEGKSMCNNKYTVFGVFDGHGGSQISSYLSSNFVNKLQKKINQKNKINEDVLTEFIDQLVNQIKIIGGQSCGSTLCVLILKNSNFKGWVINVGDSRIAKFTKNNQDLINSEFLSEAHNTRNADEVNMLLSRKGCISNNRIGGVINLTRSIGDFLQCSNGLVHTPEINKVRFKKNQRVIIASDGIWDFIRESEVKELVFKEPIKDIVKTITKKALANKSMDNISILAIEFQ